MHDYATILQLPNIFLTGDIRIGKSTAIDRAIELLNPRRVGGFRTIKSPTDIPDALGVVYIVPAEGPAALDKDHLVGIRWGNNKFSAYPEAFEQGGCAILAVTPPDADLIVMDELGVMEQRSPRFCAAVLALLDGHVPVLGVIKPQASPLLDAVRRHPNSRVIELTEGNRDSLPEIIVRQLRG